MQKCYDKKGCFSVIWVILLPPLKPSVLQHGCFPIMGGYSQSVIHLGTNIILLIILNYIISNSKK